MHIGATHFTLHSPEFVDGSSEVIKLDLNPSVSETGGEISIYDLLDLLRDLGRRHSLPQVLDLKSGDSNDIFQLFELLRHLAG